MKRVRASKEAGTAAVLSNLSAGCPPEFGELLDYSRSLYFNQYVDYDLLVERFRSLAARIECDSQTPLDWTPCPRECPLDVKLVPGLYSNPIISHNDKEDDIANESYSEDEIYEDTYSDLRSEWTMQRSRDQELTMPVEQAQLLDRLLPPIAAVVIS